MFSKIFKNHISINKLVPRLARATTLCLLAAPPAQAALLDLSLKFTVTTPGATYHFPATLFWESTTNAITGRIAEKKLGGTCKVQPGGSDRRNKLSLTCQLGSEFYNTIYKGTLITATGRGSGSVTILLGDALIHGTYTVKRNPRSAGAD
jgi:hypothetical protein